MGLLECGHLRHRPFVVPQGRGVARELARRVDQYRAMHLTTGADRRDPLLGARHRSEHLAYHLGGTVPPIGRALFRPTVLPHDLVVLMADQLENLSLRINQRGAHAARADIDGQK